MIRAPGAKLGTTQAPVTRILIAANVAIYLLTAVQGFGLNSPGGSFYIKTLLYGPFVAQGEWWRLATSMFLHGFLLHIAFNMYALWAIGTPVEQYLGSVRYIGLYFVSGLAGSAGALLQSPLTPVVGASGAIFGILGAMLIIEWQATGRLGGQAMTLIVINLVFSFTFSGHLVGRPRRRADRRHPGDARVRALGPRQVGVRAARPRRRDRADRGRGGERCDLVLEGSRVRVANRDGVVHHLVHLGIPLWEKAVRTALVYAAILGLLHLAGKRALLQLNSFDLVVLLLLSNVVQNAIIGPDNSLLGGLLGAAFLIGLNYVVVRAAYVSPMLGRLLQGSATTVAVEGKPDMKNLRHLVLTPGELVAGLRRQGFELEDTERVTLEPEGIFNATPKPRPTLGDVMRRLDEIDTKLASR